MSQTIRSREETRQGTILGVVAFGIWGTLPLYWSTLGSPGTEVLLVQRLFWAALFSLGLLAVRGDLGQLVRVVRPGATRRRLLVATALMAVNWGLYTWAMVNHQLVDAALGYFLNPLAMALLGALFRHERPEPAHYMALGLALVGVVVSALGSASFPWLALGLAASFSLYALCKSRLAVDPIVGLAFETSVSFPVALVLFLGGRGSLADLVGPSGWAGVGLLALSGPATAVPLMIFSAATQKTTMLRLGVLEYLSPTLTLVIGILAGAPFGWSDGLVFGLIGLSCAVFLAAGTVSGYSQRRSTGSNHEVQNRRDFRNAQHLGGDHPLLRISAGGEPEKKPRE